MNPNNGTNATIVTGYGNETTTTYEWNTSAYADGVYNLRVTVFENETVEGFSNYGELTGNFTIDNTKPTITLNYPDDGFNTSTNSINFNWTATDNIDTNLTCSLTIDGAVNVSGIDSLSGVPTNYSVSGLNDGTHYWNVTCWDDAPNSNTSETRNFTVDTSPPSVFDVRPVQGSTYNFTQVIEIAANVTETVSSVDTVLANITYPNSTVVTLTLNLAVGDKYNNSFVIPALAGQYNVTFVANNTFGLVNLTTVTFFVGQDNIAPNVTLNNPVDNFNASGDDVNFNWTAYDNYYTNLSCNLTLDGVVNATVASLNGTPTTYAVQNFSDGTHYWNVSCVDDASNTNTSETRSFTVDTIYPTISLNSPPNNAIDVDSNVTFNCSSTDNNNLNKIELYFNGALNQTSNVSGTANTSIFYINNLADGSYNWSCTSYDWINQANQSSTRNLTVNVTKAPTYNESYFSGNTTDWSNVPDITNVCNGTAILDNPDNDMIKWWDCVNAEDANFDASVELSQNFVEIIFGLHSSFNSSAEITMRNLSWDATPIILRDGIYCNDTCSNVTYSNGIAIFNITHFTNYTTIGNSQLEIWDQTDPDKDNLTKYTNEQIIFYANYTKKTDGTPFTGATCSIDYTDLGTLMVHNATTLLFEYNRSFSTAGTKQYNITCTGGGGQTITLSDSAFVSTSDYPPTWSNNKTNASDATKTGESVYFNVTLTDETAGGHQIFSFYNGTTWANDSTTAWSTPVELEEIRTITATRGQTVQWYWWFNDSTGNNNQTDIWNFTVANTAPSIANVNITPDTAYTTNDLTCNVSGYSDADNDGAQYYYDWYNGTNLTYSTLSASTSNVLVNGNTSKGEIWNCTVTPYDGFNNGTALYDTVTILNSVPSIVSVDVTPDAPNTTSILTCTASGWSDDDGDSEQYVYTWFD
ncbi:hypothetical protein ACFLZN_02530, partial [Nanoarchaeota archaeon]